MCAPKENDFYYMPMVANKTTMTMTRTAREQKINISDHSRWSWVNHYFMRREKSEKIKKYDAAFMLFHYEMSLASR